MLFRSNFHSYSSHYGFGLLRRAIVAYLRKFHNKAAVTLVPTEGIRRELLAHGYENIEIIGRGVDTQLFHPGRRDAALRAQWGVGENETAVLYVGRLAAEKNLSLVFSAFDAMHQAHPATRLVLVMVGLPPLLRMPPPSPVPVLLPAVTVNPSSTVVSVLLLSAVTTALLLVPTTWPTVAVTPFTLPVSSFARSPVRTVTLALGFRPVRTVSPPAKPP